MTFDMISFNTSPFKSSNDHLSSRLYGTFEWQARVPVQDAAEYEAVSPVQYLCGNEWQMNLSITAAEPDKLKPKMREWYTCGMDFSRRNLHNPKVGYVKDGVWNVGVHMCIMTTYIERQHVMRPSQCFAALHDSAAFSDIVLKTEDTRVQAHKVVLAAHSASLEAMFQCNMQEASTSEVCLGDIDGNTLKRLVSYMYGKLQSLDDCQILPLFIAADKYQVQDLRLWCLQRLILTLDASSVLQRVFTADLVHDQQLMDACMDFWANSNDSVEVAQSDAMLDFMRDKPQLARKLMVTSTRKRKAGS